MRYRIVPVEPTETQCEAAIDEVPGYDPVNCMVVANNIFKTMLSAAPKAIEDEGLVEMVRDGLHRLGLVLHSAGFTAEVDINDARAVIGLLEGEDQ